MGEQAEYDSSRYDYPDAPQPGDRQEGAAQARAAGVASVLSTAREVADRDHVYAVKIKRGNPEHAQCPGAPGYDPSVGVVCYCGAVIGEVRTEDLLAPLTPLPESTTTRAAANARPLAVPPVETPVRDTYGIASAVHPADPILARVEIIDPTQPYTSEQVEQHLLDVVRRLEEGAHFERVCAEDMYDKTIQYEQAYNRAKVRAKTEFGGSDGDRTAWAKLQCEAEWVALIIAKAKLDAIKGTMHSLRSVQSAYQSVMKSIMSAYTGTSNSNPRAF
jgi:hypothetical protein